MDWFNKTEIVAGDLLCVVLYDMMELNGRKGGRTLPN
jgi:hypothetical protein